MPEVMSFQDALQRSPDRTKRHILLGNGFSRAWRDDIFCYDALFEQANFSALSPAARDAFNALNTTDFETVIRALRQASRLATVYVADRPDLVQSLLGDADGLREVLASTIAANHPDRPAAVEPYRYEACRGFLSNFKDIYTLNYDLLLYWALMQEELEPHVEFDDGFRKPEDDAAEYVTWDTDRSYGQNLHYLHGALHIFDAGVELQKFTWCNTGTALIDQIRAALDQNRFPLFVAEGTAISKMERIEHSAYLCRAKRSFAGIGGDLFVFGFSFSESDDHILRLLRKNKISRAFVSLHGTPNSESNVRIVRRIALAVDRRAPKNPLTVEFFDADSANIWG
jgi:hypothetical protein